MESWQKETEDALEFLVKEGALPLGGVNDIRDAVRFSDTGATLTMKYLLNIAQFLRTVERLYHVEPKSLQVEINDHALLRELKQLVPLDSLEKENSSLQTKLEMEQFEKESLKEQIEAMEAKQEMEEQKESNED